MNEEILILPGQLRATSQNLRQSSQKIRASFDRVDQIINELQPQRFEGNRSGKLRERYKAQRGNFLAAASLVIRFADLLDQAAGRFEQADKNLASGNPLPADGLNAGSHKTIIPEFNKFGWLGIPVGKSDAAVQEVIENLLPFTANGTSERATFKLSGEIGLPGIELGIPGSPKVVGASGLTIQRNADGTYAVTITSEAGGGVHEPLLEASGKIHVGSQTYGAGVNASADILVKGGAAFTYTFDPNQPGQMTEMAALMGKYGVDTVTAGLPEPLKSAVSAVSQLAVPSDKDLQDNLTGMTVNLGAGASGEASALAIVKLAGVEGNGDLTGTFQMERSADNGHWQMLSGYQLSGEATGSALVPVSTGSGATIVPLEGGLHQGELTITRVVDLTTGVESARVSLQIVGEGGLDGKLYEIEKLIGQPLNGVSGVNLDGGVHGLGGVEIQYQVDMPVETVAQAFSSGNVQQGLDTIGAQSHLTVNGIAGVEGTYGAEGHLGAVSQGVDLGGQVEVSRQTVVPLHEYQPI